MSEQRGVDLTTAVKLADVALAEHASPGAHAQSETTSWDNFVEGCIEREPLLAKAVKELAVEVEHWRDMWGDSDGVRAMAQACKDRDEAQQQLAERDTEIDRLGSAAADLQQQLAEAREQLFGLSVQIGEAQERIAELTRDALRAIVRHPDYHE